jgi:hypothetical protein
MSKPIPLDSPMFRMVEKQLVEALNTDAKVRGTNALIGSLGTHSRGVLAEILGFVHIPQANVLAEQSLPEAYAAVNQQAKDLADEVQRLQAIINTPENDRFIKGVSIECEYQRIHHSEADSQKSPADWFHTVSCCVGQHPEGQTPPDHDVGRLHALARSFVERFDWQIARHRL